VIFEDNAEPDLSWIREQHAEAHFAYLADNRDKILLGGGPFGVLELKSGFHPKQR